MKLGPVGENSELSLGVLTGIGQRPTLLRENPVGEVGLGQICDL